MQYLTDEYGFPVVKCGRCGGTGTIARYSQVFQGVCFGCNGAKTCYPKGTPTRLAKQFYAWLSEAAQCDAAAGVEVAKDGTRTFTSSDFRPGDVVRAKQRGIETPWRTVARVRPTRKVCVVAWAGGRLCGLSLETEVVFTDGTSKTIMAESWERRPDPDELARLRDNLAGRACAAYERSLGKERV